LSSILIIILARASYFFSAVTQAGTRHPPGFQVALLCFGHSGGETNNDVTEWASGLLGLWVLPGDLQEQAREARYIYVVGTIMHLTGTQIGMVWARYGYHYAVCRAEDHPETTKFSIFPQHRIHDLLNRIVFIMIFDFSNRP